MYILPECFADVFWTTGIRYETNVFVVLKFLTIRWFRVIFVSHLLLMLAMHSDKIYMPPSLHAAIALLLLRVYFIYDFANRVVFEIFSKKTPASFISFLFTRARPLAARVLKWVSLLSSSSSETGSLINRYICVHLWILWRRNLWSFWPAHVTSGVLSKHCELYMANLYLTI